MNGKYEVVFKWSDHFKLYSPKHAASDRGLAGRSPAQLADPGREADHALALVDGHLVDWALNPALGGLN